MNRLAGALLPFLIVLPVQAQETRPLTEEASASIAEFYNQPGVIRLSGATRVAAGTELAGDVASVGGPFVVMGAVRGAVVVINGDLRLLPEGRITGTVVVVGGRFEGDAGAVAGGVVVYPEPLSFRWEGDRMISPGARRESWLSAGWSTDFGRADLTLAVDGSYNRVEGLPVTFGPRFELGRSNPTVLDARLIYRTRSGLRIHPDEFGHDVRLEQSLGGHRALLAGVRLHRTVDPIELNGVSDTENSLSTFIIHRDYRDHYARRGWGAYLHYGGRTQRLLGGLEYRDETHGSVRPHTPWSLLNNDEPWRAQPQVAEGDLRTLRGWLRWDTRNDRVDPATGWLIQVETEQGLEGGLRILESLQVSPLPEDPLIYYRGVGAEFTTVRVDARRYMRLGPRTRVAVRAVAEGSPDDGALPPQRQHVLGGEGTLPGYDRFALDCGARDQPRIRDFFPYYGCDRSVLFQAEGRFSLFTAGFSPGRALGLDFDLATTPELVLFADAGRAWIESESLNGREPGPDGLLYDAGIGLRLGRLAFYLAVPLSSHGGAGSGVNFFARLGPRF